MADHQRVDSLFAHFPLDAAPGYAAFLRAHARALAPLEAAAESDANRLPLLAQDLDALGQAMPVALSLTDHCTDGFRWGLRYALEGSRLGGAMLARQVAPDLPRAYLSAVHEKGGWAAFQVRLDEAAAAGDDKWLADAVRGATAAFDLFAAGAQAELGRAHG